MSRTGRNRPSGTGSIGRAVKYLAHHRARGTCLPYLFLVVATLAQLAVPSMIRRIIDAVTSGYVADQVLQALNKIPAAFMAQALPKILAALSYPATWTKDQLVTQLNANLANAPQALIWVHRRHFHLRGIPRGLCLPAGLLGGEEFAGRGL